MSRGKNSTESARSKRRLSGVGATFTSAEAKAAGMSWYDLRNLRAHGVIDEIAKGVFRRADAPPIPYLDLVAVCARYPSGTICLQSALQYWDLTDELPDQVHLAVPRSGWRPAIESPPTRVHTFANATFELGRLQVELETQETINIYSPERSVVDAVRLHHSVGTDVGNQALRRYLRRRGARPALLLDYGRQLRSASAITAALAVLL